MAIAAEQLLQTPFNILTDLPATAEVLNLVKVQRAANPLAEALFAMIEKGEIALKDGTKAKLKSEAPTLQQASWLYYLITTMKPILTVETGFDQGLTGAIMTAAHMANGLHGGHVPIQDEAKKVENGIGFKLFTEFALSGYQIMEHEPAHVLPQLYLQRLNQGMRLVYFNDAVTSDEQMMEYYYLNLLLNEGGVFVINTAHTARRYLVDYLKENRHDYAMRELDCGLTLVQKPLEADVMNQIFSVRH